MSAYKPIACHLYDELEIAAMRKQSVSLVLTDQQEIEAVIADLWARDGVEYMKLATGDVFRLDQLQSFNGAPVVDGSGNPLVCKI